MAGISSYHCFYWVWAVHFSLLIHFSSFSISFAHIRNMQIQKFDNDSIIYIDDFEFTQTRGRLELNISNISISIPNHPNNLSLSQTGFLISNSLNFRRETLCPINDSSDVFKLVYTFDKLGLSVGSTDKNRFEVVLSDFITVDGEYYLFFVSCIPVEHAISINVQYAMYNLLHDGKRRCYLSLSEVLELRSLAVFISVYLLLVWVYLIYLVLLSYKTRMMIFRIHKLMLVILLLRIFSLICKLLNKYYIMKTGCSQCWASTVLIIISGLFSEVPYVASAILIASGWSYLTTSLSLRDKMLLIINISIYIALNIAVVMVDGLLVSFAAYHVRFYCELITASCCIITVQIVAHVPLKFLRRAGLAEGKAAECLFKARLLHFFLDSVYIYYLLGCCPGMAMDSVDRMDRRTSFRLNLVWKESSVLVFYVVIVYKFRPSVLKLKLPLNDDAEKDAAKVHATLPELWPI